MRVAFFALLLNGPHDYSPLTQSNLPCRTWGSRLRAVWWSCCCFWWQSEQTLISSLRCEKFCCFTDTAGYRLFKPHSTQSRLVLTSHQTPSVLHSCHSQHFQAGAQKLSSNDISFYLREDEICFYLRIIPPHFPHVWLFLDRCKSVIDTCPYFSSC